MGKRHAGADMFAPGEQLQGVARDPTVYVVVVATVADHSLVVADAGAVFGKGRAQPIERHRARPAHVVAPVAAAVAAQLLVFEAAHRGRAAEADALWTEQDVFTALAGGQAGKTERLAPQRERLQEAGGGGVFAIARVGLPIASVITLVLGLGIEQADAVLHAQVNVDEPAADATPVVEAQLQFA